MEEERREGGETSLKDGIVERECTPFKMPAWTLELMERPLLSLLALQSSRVPEVRGPAAKPRGSASATADPTAIFTYSSFFYQIIYTTYNYHCKSSGPLLVVQITCIVSPIP